MANKIIRDKIKKLNIRQWELAEMLGISEQTIYRWLRTELPVEEQERILSVIDGHVKEG